MKQIKSKNRKIELIWFLFFFFPYYITYSVTCIATSSGNWDDPSIWSCGHVPAPTDSIIIPSGITITITTNIFIDSYLLVEGELLSNPKTIVTFGPNGTFDNYGTVSFSGVFINQGTLNNFSYIAVENLINSGTLVNHPSAEIIVNNTFKVEGNGDVENYGSITAGKDFLIQDNGNVHNYGSIISHRNLEIKGNGSLTNHSGSYIEVLNDVKIKNNGTFTNESGSTLLVCDDFQVFDFGVFQNDGYLKICAICVGSKYEKHELITKPNTALLGNGQVCMCDAAYNESNVVDTLGYVDPNLTIVNGANGDCSTPLPIYALHLSGSISQHSVFLQIEVNADMPIAELIIERQLNSENFWTPILKETNLTVDQIRNQTYYDDNLPPFYSGDIYYRVKLTDFMGNIAYSNILQLQALFSPNSVSIFPNPISHEQIFHIQGVNVNIPPVLSLYTLDGKRIERGIIFLSSGTYKVAQAITSGTYLLHIQTDEGIIYWTRVVIQP